MGSRPNLPDLEEDFSRIWKMNKTKLFQKGQIGPEAASVNGEQSSEAQKIKGRASQSGVPEIPTSLAGGGPLN